MNTAESKGVSKSIKTTAYPEMVWEAWTDMDKLAQWFVDKAKGWPAVGSTIHLTWERFGFTLDYKIAELKECKRLLLKTHIPGGAQTLSVDIRREGQFTIVDLHEGAPHFVEDDPNSSSDSAWQMSLAIMKLYLERYFGQPRNSFFCLVGASFSNEKIRQAYTDPMILRQWLLGGIEAWPDPMEPGQPIKAQLEGGPSLTGEVMTVTKHEAAYSWEEIRGYVELKSFSMGPGRQAVCVRGAGYGMDKEMATTIEDFFRPRLQRLSELLPTL